MLTGGILITKLGSVRNTREERQIAKMDLQRLHTEPENKMRRLQVDTCQVKHLGKIIPNTDKVAGSEMLKNARRHEAVRAGEIRCMR